MSANSTGKRKFDHHVEVTEPRQKKTKQDATEQVVVSTYPGQGTFSIPNNEVARPSLVCPKCQSRFVHDVELRKHYTAAHSGRYYRCTDCLIRFPTIAKLDEHMKQHSRRSDKVFLCSVSKCSYVSFRTKLELDKHFAEHHNLLNLKCNICGEVFFNKCDLDDHKLTH